MNFRRTTLSAFAAAYLSLFCLPCMAQVAPNRISVPVNPAALYILHCGGCHGVQGMVETATIPRLKDRVGYLLCTPKGRGYAIRLPNVARLAVSDDESLAALVNFVMFDLAGGSVPPGARRYSVAEVALLRESPVSGEEIMSGRAVRRGFSCSSRAGSMRKSAAISDHSALTTSSPRPPGY